MRKIILLSGLTTLFFFQLSAQNQDSLSIKRFYEKNVILYLGGGKYFKDSQGYKLGLLKNEITLSPDAISEVRKFDRDRKIFYGVTVAAEVLLVSAFLAKNRNTALTYFYASLITAGISIPFNISFKRHLGRAIWLHNRDILLR